MIVYSGPPSQAWQYTGGEMPPWVQRCCFLRRGELIHDRPSGRQLVNYGEWLVQDLDGAVNFYTPEEFATTFVPALAPETEK